MSSSQSQIAQQIATRAHEGQQDKAGRPYIEHPAQVAQQVTGDEAKAVAWLHDVVEDTSVTLDNLRDAGINEDVLTAVALMTHDPSVPYFDYIRALGANPLARQVKLADLNHNSDLSRLPNPCEKDYQRREKYQQAIEILQHM